MIKEFAKNFVDMDDMSAAGVSWKIFDMMELFQNDLSLCVGFSFDHVSAMSGNKQGAYLSF